MSQIQGKSKDYKNSWKYHGGGDGSWVESYPMIVVSQSILIHQALENTLQHFSLNGRGIRIYNARDLEEARTLAEKNPEIILVMIDNNVQVNGSYAVFVDYVENTLGIKNCCVTFKDNLLNTKSCKKNINRSGDPHYERFYNARERLIDVSRMVMITTEMENKINNPGQSKTQEEQAPDNAPQDVSWFTKEKLNTVMAHDLREPLGNIKIMLDFLTNEPDLLDKETSKDLLHRVRESANNIHELLEDYLFWSRMFKQEIYFNPGKVDMEQIARENIVLLKSTAASKTIALVSNVPENTFVFADEFMITTVIRNLVYNAIKFTPKEGEIVISTHTRDDIVEVRVSDNGVGIPRENLDKLFRTDIHLTTTGTEKESGSGLGLALCKDFIEKNGGNITIETEENKGTTFIFTLTAWSFAEYM